MVISNLTSKLNGQIVPTGSINWKDINVLATFNDEGVSASVDLDDLVFTGNEFTLIDKWKSNGLSGYQGLFQGMPFSLDLHDKGINKKIFDGYIDFTEKYVETDGCTINTTAKEISDSLTLDERLQSITYGLLYDNGTFQKSDVTKVPFVVDKYEAGAELAILAITTFITLKETITAIKESAKSVVDAIKAATPNVGLGVTVDTGDVIAAILLAVINIAYTILMISYLINLGKELLDYIYPPIRFDKGAKLDVLLERAAQHLGYTLDTGIEELSQSVFIPSKPDEKTEQEGIPRPEDFGYVCGDMFEICKNVFNAKLAVDGNKLVLRTESDPYWKKSSTYVMEGTKDLREIKQYNLRDLKGTKLFSFAVDPTGDEWTDIDYRGTSYEVKTLPKNNTRDLIRGIDDINFGVALGSRKNKLTDFEKLIKAVAGAIDKVINFLGGKSNLAKKVENRIGLLRKSKRTHSTPKLLRVTGTGKKMKLYKRDSFSAKYLYDKYHNYNSFVLNDFNEQKRIYEDVEITFCMEDFAKTIKNSYFTTYDGKEGKFTKIDWNFASNTATASFWVKEVYSKNLKEQYVEAA